MMFAQCEVTFLGLSDLEKKLLLNGLINTRHRCDCVGIWLMKASRRALICSVIQENAGKCTAMGGRRQCTIAAGSLDSLSDLDFFFFFKKVQTDNLRKEQGEKK